MDNRCTSQKNMTLILGIYYIVISIIVTLFQLALAFGAPLGKYANGGKFPGSLPKNMRFLPFIQIAILWFFLYIVLIKTEMIGNHPNAIGSIGIWFVVFFFFLGSIMNLITPSKPERMVWGPVNVLTFIGVLFIAIL
ncbi:MAG: hypothetical protein Q7I99_04700 [Acholeplasmataceae bacterium]|nr:hypothetical protein [Acholeplasmataceae bacterium]